MGYLRQQIIDEALKFDDKGLFVVLCITFIILYVIIEILKNKLPHKLSEKVVNIATYILLFSPFILAFIWWLVFF